MQIIYSVIKYEWLKASKVRTTHTLRLCATNIRKGGWYHSNRLSVFQITLTSHLP